MTATVIITKRVRLYVLEVYDSRVHVINYQVHSIICTRKSLNCTPGAIIVQLLVVHPRVQMIDKIAPGGARSLLAPPGCTTVPLHPGCTIVAYTPGCTTVPLHPRVHNRCLYPKGK